MSRIKRYRCLRLAALLQLCVYSAFAQAPTSEQKLPDQPDFADWSSSIERKDLAEAISAGVAALSLVVGVFQYWRKAKDDRVLNWQRVAIYHTIEKIHPQPASLDVIKSGYLDSLASYEVIRIPRKQAGDSEFRRALLGLQAQGLVARTPEGWYSIVVGAASMHKLLSDRARYDATGDAIIETVLADSGRYDREQLRVKLGMANQLSTPRFHGLLNSMIAQRQLLVKEGKLMWPD
jgi:hypothetical protein